MSHKCGSLSSSSGGSNVPAAAGQAMRSCPPSSLLCRIPPDQTAYCAMVADACEFNRGLSKSRASRLPFMDLATQTSQRPAPWLYRTLCERSKSSIGGSAQVVLRYSRHRWRLASQPETKKRKLAADRLWLTLQSGLSALTIPSELVPLVTKRAYAIAGLPIPSGLATSLECVNPRGSSGLSSTNTNSNTYMSSGNRGHGSSALQKKVFAPDSFSEHVKKIPAHEEEPPDVGDDHMPEESEVPATSARTSSQKHRVSDLPTPTVSGEDSLQSTDMGGPKRPSNPNEDASPVNNRTDDEVSVQSGNGTKISSNSDGFLAHSAPKFDKTFEIEETEETDEDEEADVAEAEEDDVPEFEDDMDDDVEWSQSGKTRRSYNNNSVSNNDGKFTNGRAYKSSARRQRSLSTHRGKRFSMVGNRLANRRINTKRHLPQSQRPLSGRQKYGSGRRGARTANSGNASGAHGTSFGLPQQGGVLNKDKDKQDAWDNFDEPGFQPNANLNLLTDKNDESLAAAQRSMDEELSCNSSSYPPASPLDSSVPGHDSYPGIRESGLNPLNIHQSPQLPVTENSRRLPQNSLSVSSATTPTSSYTVSPGPGSKQTMAQLLSSGSSADPALPPPSSSCGFEYRRMIPPEMVASNRENDSSPLNSSNRRETGSSSSQSIYSKEVIDSPTVNRTMDFQSSFSSRPSPARPVPVPETFAAPQGATTTVTFFVCEVCASRYRSTAGLRYHYHSQHSGYTPKNPISASASRLVVPVGEERGIGGGLRGGRPRRTKAGNTESRPKQKNKENDTKSFSSTPGPTEVAPGGTESMDKYRENSAQIPTSMRPDSMPTFSPNYMGSSTINSTRPPCETPPRFASNMRSFARNPVNMNCVPGAPDSLISSKGMNSGSGGGGGGGGGGGNEEMWGNRSGQANAESNMPLTSVGVIPPPMNNPLSSGMQNSEEMIDLLRGGSPKHLHTLQSISSAELNTNSNSSGPRASPSRPPSTTGSHPPISSYSSLPQMGWMQPPQQQSDPYGPPQSSQHSLPPSEHGQMFTPYRLTPNQRRYERQHCPDRLNLARPPPMTCIPTCVYCLGDDRLNQRLGRPEGLLRCCRCGQWAHFSCLRLPPHVLGTAMHYPWQCIDCKTCWLCGSPDHENRMVFCGDCDRTFHIDCLPSPLPRVPDGHWSCDICLHELYAMSKGPSDKFTSPMAPEMPYYAATVKDH